MGKEVTLFFEALRSQLAFDLEQYLGMGLILGKMSH